MDMYEGHGVLAHMQSPNLVISGADGQGGPRHIRGMLGPGTGGTGTQHGDKQVCLCHHTATTMWWPWNNVGMQTCVPRLPLGGSGMQHTC